jgi:hypothetical protein
MGQRAFLASREAHKSTGVFGHFRARNISFALRRAQFHFRDQTAKVLVAFARLH